MATEAAPTSTAVKDEPREDVADSKKKRRTKADDGTKDAGNLVPKKKDEEQAEDGAGEEEPGDEDAMAPEAEPTHPRNEVPPGTTKFREDAVHVYGLDFLKTGHMEEIFGQFRHRYIEWINDSSANVVFKDSESARKALESLSYPKVGDDPWRRTPDILVHDDLPAVYLQMRLAAACDAKPRKRGVPSANPPLFMDESELGRDSRFTVSSLYDKRQKADRGSQKKGPQGIPEVEIDKRKRRADRFAETLGPPPAAPKPAEEEKASDEKKSTVTEPAVTEKKDTESTAVLEDDSEEKAKRQKRAERFNAPKPPSGNSPSVSEKAAEGQTVEKTPEPEKKADENTSQTVSASNGDEAAKNGEKTSEK